MHCGQTSQMYSETRPNSSRCRICSVISNVEFTFVKFAYWTYSMVLLWILDVWWYFLCTSSWPMWPYDRLAFYCRVKELKTAYDVHNQVIFVVTEEMQSRSLEWPRGTLIYLPAGEEYRFYMHLLVRGITRCVSSYTKMELLIKGTMSSANATVRHHFILSTKFGPETQNMTPAICHHWLDSTCVRGQWHAIGNFSRFLS